MGSFTDLLCSYLLRLNRIIRQFEFRNNSLVFTFYSNFRRSVDSAIDRITKGENDVQS